jgi:small-conductance mechanosensitive channel
MDTLMNKSPLVENEEAFSSCGLLTLKLLPEELIAIQSEISYFTANDPMAKMNKKELFKFARKLRCDKVVLRRKALDNQDLLSRRERATEELAEELAREREDREKCEADLEALKAELKKEQEGREECELSYERLKEVNVKHRRMAVDWTAKNNELRALKAKLAEEQKMATEMAVRCEQQQDFIDSMVGYQSFEDWVSLKRKNEEDEEGCESDESSD